MSVNCYPAVSLQELRHLCVERVTLDYLGPSDFSVKAGAVGGSHADLKMIKVSLRAPLPVGGEAVGAIGCAGPEARRGADGDIVILSWNSRCGDCFNSDYSRSSLCDEFLDRAPKREPYDRRAKAASVDGRGSHQMMFAQYCVAADQEAMRVPQERLLEWAALNGCGVTTGIETIIAADLKNRCLNIAAVKGASKRKNVRTTDLPKEVSAAAGGRGSGGRRPFQRLREGRRAGPSRPRGDLAGEARPRHDFPHVARAYLGGRSGFDGLNTGRISRLARWLRRSTLNLALPVAP